MLHKVANPANASECDNRVVAKSCKSRKHIRVRQSRCGEDRKPRQRIRALRPGCCIKLQNPQTHPNATIGLLQRVANPANVSPCNNCNVARGYKFRNRIQIHQSKAGQAAARPYAMLWRAPAYRALRWAAGSPGTSSLMPGRGAPAPGCGARRRIARRQPYARLRASSSASVTWASSVAQEQTKRITLRPSSRT